eukprot:gene682-684_t
MQARFQAMGGTTGGNTPEAFQTYIDEQHAIAPIQDGASIIVSGFGEAGVPYELMNAIIDKDLKELVIIANNAGTFDRGIAAMIRQGRVRKVICSHPRPPNSEAFAEAVRALLDGLSFDELQSKTGAPLKRAPNMSVIKRIKAQLNASGYDIVASTPEAFAKTIEKDLITWRKAVKESEKGGYAVDTINEIQFGERIAHELDLWQEVVTKGNIRPE